VLVLVATAIVENEAGTLGIAIIGVAPLASVPKCAVTALVPLL
jgi:hypothetical protein